MERSSYKLSKPDCDQDIQTRKDVETLVGLFYNKVRPDELLGPIFNYHIPTEAEWSEHLQTMNNFWETVLFSKSAYRGNPFPKHINLDIDPRHFERWIILFEKTVDENFSGNQAEGIKKRARLLRQIFEAKLFDNQRQH
jgi:hemoglobin